MKCASSEIKPEIKERASSSGVSDKASFSNLPDNVLIEIAGNLSEKDLGKFRLTEKGVKKAIEPLAERIKLEKAERIMKTGNFTQAVNVISEPGFPADRVAEHIFENPNTPVVEFIVEETYFSPPLQMKLLDVLEDTQHMWYKYRNAIYARLAQNISLCEEAQNKVKESGDGVSIEYLLRNRALTEDLQIHFAKNGTEGQKKILADNAYIKDNARNILSAYNDPEINQKLENALTKRQYPEKTTKQSA